MALTKCKECGKEVSDQAGKCPHCGFKVTKPAGWVSYVIAVAAAFAVVQCSISTSSKSSTKTPSDPMAEARFQKTVMFAAGVKSKMRDPSSFVLETALANDDASIICLEYRARNGFGGINKEFIVSTTKRVSQDASAWNKHCTKPLFDIKHVEHALK